MNVLKLGSSGKDVEKWQYFLRGQNLFNGIVNGKFGADTRDSTIEFQKKYNLQPDGKVGDKTIGMAMTLGFGVLEDTSKDKSGQNWPPKPKFPPLVSNSDREKVFGKFKYRHNPLPDNQENIEIIDNWERQNIITVEIPQLTKIKGTPRVRFHKLAANKLKNLWKDWEQANLLHLILTWEGSFVPRFVRGSRTNLSNHSFGSAFDINYAWNKLGSVPALVGQKGSVRELVQ